jgi:hypothetical protein
MRITSNVIASFLEQSRSVYSRDWTRCFGNSQAASAVLRWLDSLGVTAKCLPRNQRALIVPLETALEIIERSDFTWMPPRKVYKGRGARDYDLLWDKLIDRAIRDDGGFKDDRGNYCDFSLRDWVMSDDFEELCYIFGVDCQTVREGALLQWRYDEIQETIHSRC